MNKFHGTGVAMVTPFQADGQVDYDALQKLIDHLIDGGGRIPGVTWYNRRKRHIE